MLICIRNQILNNFPISILKITFIAPLPPPLTGQSLAAQTLLKSLQEFDEVRVISSTKEKFQQGVNSFGRWSSIAQILIDVWRYRFFADVVYFNVSQSVSGNLKDLLIYAICWPRLGRIVIHLHGGAGMRVLLGSKYPFLRTLNSVFLKRLGAVVVLGDSHRSIYENTVSPARLFTVPNFAMDELFVSPSAVDKKFACVKPLRILFLSNLLPGKGHVELLAALSLLPENLRERLQFDIAGGFESTEHEVLFREMVLATRGIRIYVHGIVQGEQKRELLSKAHLFCLPTYYPYEGQPISILEAYASGCAVMTTNHSGIFDIFTPDINGIEVNPRSSESIAYAIQSAMADTPKLCGYAVNNLKLAQENYRVFTHVEKLRKIITTVAQEEKLKHLDSPTSNIFYKICSHCIMDNSDPNIKFDIQNRCNYCNNFDSVVQPNWDTGSKGQEALSEMADTIRASGKGRDFDCIIGLSGGLDSSYATYIAKEKMGLRPLLLHVDAGWNTDQAVGNIEKLVDGLGLDLYTEVVNWDEMRRLQVAFLKAGIPDQDLVQDAAFFSGLYKFARKHGVKHIITGANFSTECCREPEEWGGYLGIDKRLFGDIWRKFGEGELNTFPLTDILTYKLWYQKVLGMKMHHPLNLVPFVKKEAEDELERLFGWQRFKHKHHESRFTRFYEDYWLPRRFGFEKRRAHFSSLIMTGQMTREEAVERISRPEMDEHFLTQEFEYVAHKLGLTVAELQQLFEAPKKTFHDYKNKRRLIGLGTDALRWLGLEKRYFR